MTNIRALRTTIVRASALFAICAFAVALGPIPARSQQANQYIGVRSSQQVFSVMCALDAAGFDADSPTLGIYPLHAALRERLLQLQTPAALAVRQYYQKHQFLSPDETLEPFLTFALIIGPPPDFPLTVSRDDIPPSALTVDDFGPLLRNFYAQAHLRREWLAVKPEVDEEMDRLNGPLHKIVFTTTAYLRELMNPQTSRTFTVYVEPLVGNRVLFRNIGDRYAMIVGPGPQLPLDSIRHGFLHFMLDPLVLRYQQVISTRRVLLKIADRAPQLPLAYQRDFIGLFDECLVRAAELRLENPSPSRLAAVLQNDDRTGFILVRPLYRQLILFEKAQPAMSFYFPALATGINVSAEEKRFADFQFASTSEKIASSGLAGEADAGSPAQQLQQQLLLGDRQIAMQNGKAAAATFQSILRTHPNLPRAVYGLAIASVLQGQGEKAEDLFKQLVHAPPNASKNMAPTPDILAWAHVYLGRIQDLQGNRAQAEAEYKAALAVVGAPEEALVAAQQGLNTPYAAPSKGAQR